MIQPNIRTLPLIPNLEFTHPASEEQVAETARSLEARGFHAIIVETGEQACTAVLEMIPSGAEVYNSPSRTLEQIGLAAEIEASTRVQPLRTRLRPLDRVKQQSQYRKLISGTEVLVGSVQAITRQGQVILASATGSQLSAAAFGAMQVIWVAGAQKIVPSYEEGMRRIREYCHPLEDERTRQVYGQPSAINKVLVLEAETPGRITIVLVKQILGF